VTIVDKALILLRTGPGLAVGHAAENRGSESTLTNCSFRFAVRYQWLWIARIVATWRRMDWMNPNIELLTKAYEPNW